MPSREPSGLPDSFRPMLAVLGELPPDDGTWAHEMKWDGLRAIAHLSGGVLQLRSRTGRDITRTFPDLGGLADALPVAGAVLDGEIVALGDGASPSFESLQLRMNVADPAQVSRLAAQVPVTYLAFDLLQVDRLLLLSQPYQDRRALLDQLAVNGQRWQTPPSFTGEPGADLLRVSLQHGLEGLVAKRLDSRYVQGRSASWRKIKNIQRQEVVVGGWKPGQGARAGLIGSLLIGVQDGTGLAYAGHVGTGFGQQELLMLGQRLAPLRRADSPFAGEVPREYAREAVWAEPLLVVEVAFAGWTSAGRMREPSYKGLRIDKDPAEVVREG
jgi:bifunctional non-homologous end joining protein LigD